MIPPRTNIAFLAWVVILLVAVCSVADERSECERLAAKYEAETEVILFDQTRVDLLSSEYAIEVDWSRKWAEAVGQSLYYAAVTGRRPAVILLVKDATAERRYVYRCLVICARADVRLFVEQVD